MALQPSTRLGPYEIVSSIGAGGMGEVYSARDTRLDRTVAIKVLPEHLSRNPQSRERFEREAKAISSLSHPHICPLYDVGHQDGVDFLVMEYLEGETLAHRLKKGPLPAEHVVQYAIQIADALDTAHRRGVIHRDLKPANIMLTKTGTKLLDFGLAKVQVAGAAAGMTALPTQTTPLTGEGAILGTMQYMAPEQLEGAEADARTDIFALGAVIYEMATGRKAFEGKSHASLISAIMTAEPPAISTLQPLAPSALDHVVRTCIAKDPDARWQAAHDVLVELKWLKEAGSGSSPGLAAKTAANRAWRRSVPVTIGIATLGIVLAVFFARRAPQSPAPQLLASVLPPPGEGLWADLTQPAAVSPNGVFIAMVAMRDAHTQLWLRRMDSSEAQPVAGTEDAENPFWSPDSRYVGFFADEKLEKVDVSGGVVSNICPAGFASMGGTWSSQGVILFSVFADKIKRVSATGGTPEPVSGLPLSSDALGQYWPSFLPDGKHFLYLEWRYHSPSNPDNSVWIGSLDGDKPRHLPLASTNVEYSAGYLLFNRDGDLVAQPFDLQHLELRGSSSQPVVRSIQYDSLFDNAAFTVSGNGILVFAGAGIGVNTELTWMDGSGKTIGTLGEPEQFLRQAISPDAKHVAVGVKRAGASENIWIYDVERRTRIPLDPGLTYSPRWSFDGKQIAYRLLAGKTSELYIRDADGTGDARQIGGKFDGVMTVEDWSPDGHFLSCTFARSTGSKNWKNSLQVLPVAHEARPRLEISDASGGKFSPDGTWLAYEDNSSGQVYVTRFPGPGPRIAVTSSSGGDPRWRGDGQELFYISNDQTLFSVQVRETAQEFRVLSSRPLFHLTLPSDAGFYDVTRDGKRFLVNTRTHKEQSAALTVVTNWSSMLQAH